ncbi:MAG: aldehyde dehydrogenase family protein, partial [Burkholderiales bacterium]|nr:aldehyde dehydrogenase family protein [Burkholderiales bacterium]
MPSTDLPVVPLLIDGEFVTSRSTQWREIVDPATQKRLARVPMATRDEVAAAVAAAAAAFPAWRRTSIGTRARIFLKYQQLIRDNMKS